ncbi:MAG TPA: cellulase family glycosylhydrolase [Candidatus Dormibacteraeota bacterium]|nr:cellulase family glycosylhydrolase [Candidatus Dormibacteraeota bacterium]
MSAGIRDLPIALLAAVLVAACGDGGTPAARPTATVTVAATASPSASVTASPSASATRSAAPTPSDSPAPPVTATASDTASPTATATQPPLRLPDLHAEPDAELGGRIVDAEGREVLLRGVNVNALAEYWQYGAFATVFPLTEADADQMAAIGWNAVRLLLSWSRVEPAPGEYDAAYLEQVRTVVRLLASRGIYTILDLHQDAWGATLVARPDEVCAPPGELAFGWDGAPGWATLDGGAPRCATLGIRELSPAVSAAFAAFFADATDTTGVGIRTRYAAMLGHLARVLAAEPGVAGYDLMNEPNAFSEEEIAQLADLYADAIVAIRAGERDAGSPTRLVLFEPSAVWALLGVGAPADFARDRDVVYAPHLYQGGLDTQALAPAFAKARDEAKRYGGAPVLTGEWGSDPRRASDPADPYFLEHQRLQDESRIGATLWTWHESCGDPHKAGDVRAGNVPYVWGEFEVDCTSNTIAGLRQDLVAQLTRGYVRAAPGRLVATTYDPDTGVLTASGVDAPAGAELLAFFPSADEIDGVIGQVGLTDVRLLREAADRPYITARAVGGPWRITAIPPSDATRAR